MLETAATGHWFNFNATLEPKRKERVKVFMIVNLLRTFIFKKMGLTSKQLKLAVGRMPFLNS